MLKIVLDAMGGDNAPAAIVQGAVLALKERKDFAIVLTGDENLVRAELKKCDYDASRIEVVHCTEVITNDDVPTSAVRTKRGSSLVVGLKILREDEEAGAFVSAGSTGAVLAGGIMYLGRIKGVMRPALCPAIPNVRGGKTLLCDAGANAECKPPYLVQFAIMATAYGRAAFGMKYPRVGLLSNGTEEHKGDPVHQEAFSLLNETAGVNFAGNVEGRDIMYGDLDVVVADGLTGNVALKSMEGCGKTVSSVLRTEFTSSFGGKLRYLFARKSIKKLQTMLDYNRYGGAVFLGLKKTVIKAHGSSKPKTVTAALVQAVDAVRGNLVQTITDMLEEAGFGNETV